MGLTQKLGTIPLAIFTDASNNIGIGGSPSGSYKFEVTGTGRFTGALTGTSVSLSSTLNLGSIANSGDTSLLNIKQSSTSYNNGIYIERGGERNGYFMYIGGSLDSLTFRRNYFGTQSDVMSLTRDGNVGIGTSSPTNPPGFTRFLNISGTDAALTISNTNGTAKNWTLGALESGNFLIADGTTERMRITSTGRVGINTSSPAALFEVRGTGNSAINSHGNLLVSSGGTATQVADTGGQISFGAWLNGDLSVPYPVAAIKGVSESSTTDVNKGALLFCTMNSTTNAERMRITSGGEVLMNATSVLTSGWLCIAVPSNNYNAIVLKDTGTTYSSGNYYQLFTNSNNSIAGSVSHPTSGTTSFNTSSDYRLKEDFKDFDGTSVLSNLKFYDFKWKEDNVRMYGVKAHEVDEFVPLAVSGTKDAVDENGNIIAQGVDYSKLVPVIGKALQEAIAKIEQLEAKVSALENKS